MKAANCKLTLASFLNFDINDCFFNSRVIVLGLASHHYSLNKVGIRGSTTIAIRTLEAMGHTVVPISLDKWKALADFEKLPYLMQTIKGKLRDDIVKCESIC